MPDKEIDLMAHLMRRAGFGATRDELEAYVAKGYEVVVDELLHPETAPPAVDDEDLWRRYYVGEGRCLLLESAQAYWLRRMIKTKRPLEEKMGLFWHQVFATSFTKLNQPKQILKQIDTFRRYGLGCFPQLLVQLSKDPAMIFYLDNKDSHQYEPNENYGRELLELFTMGVGNYTEQDVFEASRAFTGWTMANASLQTARVAQDSVEPYGLLDWQFEYKEDDHDDTEKVFLGHRGRFNGEDVIGIICDQEATARFISRHLYNFFVADEVQVPAWETVPPRDPNAIEILTKAYFDGVYEIRHMLGVLFNSDFFKEAAFAKVKSPAELVAGVVRLTGGLGTVPEVYEDVGLLAPADMGQQLLDPPSVEGWHTGAEWLDTGSLVARVNFASEQFADLQKPGVKAIVNRIKAMEQPISPERLVDACLDLMGPMTLLEGTKEEMIGYARASGTVRFGSEQEDRVAGEKVKRVLQLIVAAREYQLA